MTEADLQRFCVQIVELTKENQIYAEVAEIAIPNIHSFLVNSENTPMITEEEPPQLPPQLQEIAGPEQQYGQAPPIQPPYPIYTDSVMPPVMGPQMNSFYVQTSNIPFLYHQQP